MDKEYEWVAYGLDMSDGSDVNGYAFVKTKGESIWDAQTKAVSYFLGNKIKFDVITLNDGSFDKYKKK